MNKGLAFQLFLFFNNNIDYVQAAVKAGVHGIILDWEHIGKEKRQTFCDTQINLSTLKDLRCVRRCCNTRIICRINGYGKTTSEEIKQAVRTGADELLLPMVRTPQEVEAVLDQVAGRCGVGILIETKEAVKNAEKLAWLPLSRVYLGLNDLAIERRTPNIFTPIVDGTLGRIRYLFNEIPFGFAGLTLPYRGYPVPCRLLIGEMARLGCGFSFLRRSFYGDMRGRSLPIEIEGLLDALRNAINRDTEAIKRERQELEYAIRKYPKSKTIFSRNKHAGSKR
ncbi:MAG: aldolase/citrate lyase family protein [Planctomycetota bacterium]|jgi:hypothetical protein